METTKQLTDSQKRAIELIGRLADEGKIKMSEAIQLIMAIYEKEIVYIPYQIPYSYPEPQPWITRPWTQTDDIPWWEQNKIMCGDQANNTHADPNKVGPFTYTVNGTNWGPFDWITNVLNG